MIAVIPARGGSREVKSLNRTPLPEWGNLPLRIVDRIDASGDCWEWEGTITRTGYGLTRYEGRSQPAHRVIWTILVGPVPAHLDLDHLCRNRGCVNPDHLEPVTRSENCRRGQTGGYLGNRTHCSNGHEYTISNTHIRPDGSRACRTCVREYMRERRRKKRGT